MPCMHKVKPRSLESIAFLPAMLEKHLEACAHAVFAKHRKHQMSFLVCKYVFIVSNEINLSTCCQQAL